MSTPLHVAEPVPNLTPKQQACFDLLKRFETQQDRWHNGFTSSLVAFAHGEKRPDGWWFDAPYVRSGMEQLVKKGLVEKEAYSAYGSIGGTRRVSEYIWRLVK